MNEKEKNFTYIYTRILYIPINFGHIFGPLHLVSSLSCFLRKPAYIHPQLEEGEGNVYFQSFTLKPVGGRQILYRRLKD